MKTIKSLLLILFVSTLLVSCEDDRLPNDILLGRWVILSNAKENALVLDFGQEDVEVKNSSQSYYPFTYDAVWSYYIDRDSVLHLSRYGGYDNDYGNYYEYLDFDISIRDQGNTLILYYDRLFASTKRYTFIRRR